MMRIRRAGLMAGGVGSRLRADGIQEPKPFLEVAGKQLVSYFLDEAHSCGIDEVHAVVPEHDQEIQDGLASDKRFDWTFFSSPHGAGTFYAVETLVSSLGDWPHVIATCDTVMPKGCLQRLMLRSSSDAAHPTMTLLTTDVVQDETPIWVHADNDGQVSKVGKGIAHSSAVFGNIRVVTAGFSSILSELNLNGVVRDTQFLQIIAETLPGRLRSHFEVGVVDVDNVGDLKFAEGLIAGGGNYL